MILCVNLNAAIDKTVTVEDFTVNKIHRPNSILAIPGGKGVNVARVLKTLGEVPLVTGLIGGHAGNFIEEGLHNEGIRTSFARYPKESRTCLSILDSSRNTLTEIYEKGDLIPDEALQNFIELFTSLLVQVNLVTLSGSLPPGIPPDIYSQLANKAFLASVPVYLDSGGDALRFGLREGHISLVKPNLYELKCLLGRDPGKVFEIGQVAKEIHLKSGATVVVSLGPEGLVAAKSELILHAKPPPINIVSAVGSGDATLAALATAYMQKLNLHESLSLAVAAGAANAMILGAGRLNIDEVARIRDKVEILDIER